MDRPPTLFEMGESSSTAQTDGQKAKKYEVGSFLKNDSRLFFGLADLKEAIRWLENAQSIFLAYCLLTLFVGEGGDWSTTGCS